MRYRPRRHNGFTLLELLIALSVTMAVVALVFAGFGVVGRSLERSQQNLSRADQMLLVEHWLSKKFDTLRPLSQRSEGHFVLFFSGNSAGAMWVAPLPERGQAGGLHILRATPERHPGGQVNLLIQALPYQGPDTALQWDTAPREILFLDVRTLQWAYQGASTEPWQAQWDASQATYPTRIKLQLGDAQGDWPELIFPLTRAQ